MPSVADWLLPLMAEHDFHLYLTGHTHDYERGESHGVTHIIAGGGGASLDEWCSDVPEVEVIALKHHYLNIEAGCDQLLIEAHAVPEEAEPIDVVVIDR